MSKDSEKQVTFESPENLRDIQKKIAEFGRKVDAYAFGRDFDSLSGLLNEMENFYSASDYAATDAGLFYFLGTGYNVLAEHILFTAGNADGKPDSFNESVVKNRRKAFFYFRKSLALFDSYSKDEQCRYKDQETLYQRLLTNYANALDAAGRPVAALHYYRESLLLNPDFSMTDGNYGRALSFLADLVNDSNESNDLHIHAYQAMKSAVTHPDADMTDEAIGAFSDDIHKYEAYAHGRWKEILNKPVKYKKYSLGRSKAEQMYRHWCLANRLFLNPLNELMKPEAAFAHDPLTITSFTEDNDKTDSVNNERSEPPRWFAMLNQLKEEYVYARYLCYDSCDYKDEVHFADKGTSLTLGSYDYCIYSIRVEELKTAFRTLYSMLDQIFFFVNDFWNLGLKEREADARHVYKSGNYPKNNIAFMGLYWVLSEFNEDYAQEVAGESSQEPGHQHPKKTNEKNLSDLRNALEHKFVKVQDVWDGDLTLESDHFYHISEDNLQKYTLRLCRIVREALMYLVYAIDQEERKKDHSKMTVPLVIADYSDEWKR